MSFTDPHNIVFVSGVTQYNVQVSDDIINVDTSINSVTIILPNIQDAGLQLTPKKFYINDYSGNADVNNITIVAINNIVNSGTSKVLNSVGVSAECLIVGQNEYLVNSDNTTSLGYNQVQEEGTNLTKRNTLNFIGSTVMATDDAANNRTNVTVIHPESYNTVQDEGVNLPQRTTINFVGAGVNAFDYAGVTTVNITGGGTATYPTIQDEGVSLPVQPIIDFQGAGVTATNGVGKTIITIPSAGASRYSGSFYDTTNQTSTSGQILAMNFNTPDISNGVSIVNNILGQPTRITVANAGTYNVQFSAQLSRPQGGGGSASDVNIWLALNGNDIPWSNTKITMQANDKYIVAAWNWFVTLTAGQYVEIMWSQQDSIFLAAVPAGVHPAIPSVILTVNQI